MIWFDKIGEFGRRKSEKCWKYGECKKGQSRIRLLGSECEGLGNRYTIKTDWRVDDFGTLFVGANEEALDFGMINSKAIKAEPGMNDTTSRR